MQRPPQHIAEENFRLIKALIVYSDLYTILLIWVWILPMCRHTGTIIIDRFLKGCQTKLPFPFNYIFSTVVYIIFAIRKHQVIFIFGERIPVILQCEKCYAGCKQ